MPGMENIAADPDARAKRNVRVLVAAQAVLGAQMPINFVISGLAGQFLAPDKCLATLPISLIVGGSMVTAPWLAEFMQRRGRRLGFMIGAAGGFAGSLTMAAAILIHSFPLMLLGAFLSGIYMSGQGFYRFAATDTASAAYRAQAISWVLGGGLISAILGPQLVRVSADLLAPVPFAGAYLAAAALNLVGVWVFLLLDIPKPAAPAADAPRGRTRRELLASPVIAVAMICGMVSYALMNLVMTSTPLAVVGCGFGVGDASNIVSAHVVAMFLPSFFTGALIRRFGVMTVMGTGLAILAAAGLVALAGVDLMNFYGALILLGLGWNFGFIGATALLSTAHAPEERARVQGMNDFAVFGLVTFASLASGFLMNCSGGSVVEGWDSVNIAMIPLLALAGAALVWLAVMRRPA
jgi:MFS family permease